MAPNNKWKIFTPLKISYRSNYSLRVFLEKSNKIQDMYHNISNNLEATFVKLNEKIQYFISEFIDVWQQFAESYCFVTVAVKRSKKSFRY